MKLKTRHLILRPWREEDAECLYGHAKNPKIGPIAGWPPHSSVEDSLNIIRTVLQKKETYAITFKEDDNPIGCIGLLVYPDGNYYWGEENGELGYWLAEPFWGRGIVMEASRELIKRAFDDLKLKRIYAIARRENHQSIRVLEKLGFNFLNEMQNVDYKNQQYTEILMYLKR